MQQEQQQEEAYSIAEARRNVGVVLENAIIDGNVEHMRQILAWMAALDPRVADLSRLQIRTAHVPLHFRRQRYDSCELLVLALWLCLTPPVDEAPRMAILGLLARLVPANRVAMLNPSFWHLLTLVDTAFTGRCMEELPGAAWAFQLMRHALSAYHQQQRPAMVRFVLQRYAQRLTDVEVYELVSRMVAYMGHHMHDWLPVLLEEGLEGWPRARITAALCADRAHLNHGSTLLHLAADWNPRCIPSLLPYGGEDPAVVFNLNGQTPRMVLLLRAPSIPAEEMDALCTLLKAEEDRCDPLRRAAMVLAGARDPGSALSALTRDSVHKILELVVAVANPRRTYAAPGFAWT